MKQWYLLMALMAFSLPLHAMESYDSDSDKSTNRNDDERILEMSDMGLLNNNNTYRQQANEVAIDIYGSGGKSRIEKLKLRFGSHQQLIAQYLNNLSKEEFKALKSTLNQSTDRNNTALLYLLKSNEQISFPKATCCGKLKRLLTGAECCMCQTVSLMILGVYATVLSVAHFAT